MPTLNEGLHFTDLPVDHQRAFRGGLGQKWKFGTHTRFYKRTQHGLVDPRKKTISPWWSLVSPTNEGFGAESALSTSVQRSNRLGVSHLDFTRARAAVSKDWPNDMTNLLVMQLTQPVYGFLGQCAHQRLDHEDPETANVFLIGGAEQVYLPKLREGDALVVVQSVNT